MRNEQGALTMISAVSTSTSKALLPIDACANFTRRLPSFRYSRFCPIGKSRVHSTRL